MNTGVQDYYDKRWILRAIKREQDLTPAGEIVKISTRQLTDNDHNAPATDDIRKHIRLFQSEGLFRVEKKYIDDPTNPYDPVDVGWGRATIFELAINQEIFDVVCNGYENPVGPVDLKSDDAVYFKEEKAKIGAIKHPEDHKLEQERWLEIKNILDAIYRQLSPMGGNNQTVSVGLKKTHKNISQSLLDDLWDRGICGYGGGAQTLEWERIYYRQGSLIQVRDLDRFNKYRNGVSDFVKWIEQDGATRFSKTGIGLEPHISQYGKIQAQQTQTDTHLSGDEKTAEFLVTVAPGRAAELLTLLDEFYNFHDDKRRLELYAKFIRWDLDVGKALRKLKNLNYCNDWLSVKSFFPKNRRYEFPSGAKALRYLPLDDLYDHTGKTAEEKKEQVIGDFNELRSIMKEKLAILMKFQEKTERDRSEQTAVPRRVASATKGASDFSLASQRKLRLLDILKEEWDLTPKVDRVIRSWPSNDYITGGVCKVHWDTFTQWLPRVSLTSHEQLQNLLNLFTEEGLIEEWKIFGPETIIEIKFPADFERCYESYKSQILGSKENTKSAELSGKTDAGAKNIGTQGVNEPVPTFPRKSELPSGIDWPSFTFQFLDEEYALIIVRNIKEKLSYEDMGFKDKRKSEKWPPYDSQWRLLLDLAECGGEIEPQSSYAKPENEKAKEKLTNKLQAYFSIHYDPFFKVEYSKKGLKKRGSYKTRMTLLPPPPSENKSVEHEDELTKEIRQDYSDQTPTINDSG